VNRQYEQMGMPYPIDCTNEAVEILKGRQGRLLRDGSLFYYYGPILGWQLNPTALAYFVLGLEQIWAKENDERVRRVALSVSKNLLARGEVFAENSIGFPIHFAPLGYKPPRVWYSSLAQSYCASAFRRIGLIEGDESWVELGRQVMRFVFQAPQLCTQDKDGGGYWFQECPMTPLTPILNGHMSTLIGFLDIGTASDDRDCLACFESGLSALIANLPRFDAGGLSLYDSRRGILAKPSYQKLHVVQLRFLARVTGETVLSEFADKWEHGFIQKWGARALLSYAKGTLRNGVRIDGLEFPLRLLSYGLGDSGLGIMKGANSMIGFQPRN
jgi:hypothetical protein